MVFKVEISNLEKILEKFFGFIKIEIQTKKCRGAKLDKSTVHPSIIYKVYKPKFSNNISVETEIRCQRYNNEKCVDPLTDASIDFAELPYCTYIGKK